MALNYHQAIGKLSLYGWTFSKKESTYTAEKNGNLLTAFTQEDLIQKVNNFQKQLTKIK